MNYIRDFILAFFLLFFTTLVFSENNFTHQPIKINSVQIKEIFPAHYKHYSTNSIGVLKVTNTSTKKIKITSTQVMIKEYMHYPTPIKIDQELSPEQTLDINLFAILNNNILNITEDMPTIIQIQVKYKIKDLPEKTIIHHQPIVIYNRNAITWDNLNKIAAFITPKDSVINLFSRKVMNKMKKYRVNFIPDNIQTAIFLFNALKTYNISYLKDPKNPFKGFTKKRNEIDYIQFPQDVLKYRSGDCDDLTVLYSSLLENLGIETAIISTPEHLFMMFNTGFYQSEKKNIQFNKNQYVIYKEMIWIPMELTLIGEPFYISRKTAIKKYYDFLEKKQIEIILLKDAWYNYPPANIQNKNWKLKLPPFNIIFKHAKIDINFIRKNNLKYQVDQWKKQLKVNHNNSVYFNKLGIIFAKYEKYKKAIFNFKKSIKSNSSYFLPLNNLGYIYLLKKNYDLALTYFKKAQKIEPDNKIIQNNLELLTKRKEEEKINLKNQEKKRRKKSRLYLGVVYQPLASYDDDSAKYFNETAGSSILYKFNLSKNFFLANRLNLFFVQRQSHLYSKSLQANYVTITNKWALDLMIELNYDISLFNQFYMSPLLGVGVNMSDIQLDQISKEEKRSLFFGFKLYTGISFDFMISVPLKLDIIYTWGKTERILNRGFQFIMSAEIFSF